MYLFLLKRVLLSPQSFIKGWGWNRETYAQAKWPGKNRAKSLFVVDAMQYISPISPEWGRHLIRARDDFQYIVTVPSGFASETLLATQVVCNGLARSFGLAVPEVAIVSVCAKLLNGLNDSRPGRAHRTRRGSELCVGFRYVDSMPLSDPSQRTRTLTPRSTRQLLGWLVFDIWTMNLVPREWVLAMNETTGKTDSILVENNGGLAGGDWALFLASDRESLPAPQSIATRVRKWEQVHRWITRAGGLDLNPLWDTAFQMPLEWYGCKKADLADVLKKLGSRKWDLPMGLHHFVRRGYCPNLELPPSRVPTAVGGEVASVTKSA